MLPFILALAVYEIACSPVSSPTQSNIKLFHPSLDLYKKIFIGVELLHNVLLVSAVQRSESAICIPVPSLLDLPPTPPPFHPSRSSQSTEISFSFRSPQSIEQSSLCYTVCSHKLSILYIVSIVYIYVNPNLPIHPTLPFPLGIHTFVL